MSLIDVEAFRAAVEAKLGPGHQVIAYIELYMVRDVGNRQVCVNAKYDPQMLDAALVDMVAFAASEAGYSLDHFEERAPVSGGMG